MEKKLYGFYSKQAYSMYGALVYSTPDGRTVEVTAVDYTTDAPEYIYPDKKFVGEVISYIKGAPIKLYDWYEVKI